MTDRPILFSGPMVCALLDGRKTQTRRLLKIKGRAGLFQFGISETKGFDWTFRRKDHVWEDYKHDDLLKLLPIHKGDRLWVREVFSGVHHVGHIRPSKRMDYRTNGVPYLNSSIWYWADGNPDSGDWEKPRPSIHMPRWASRITLHVTDVRIQRLNDISADDCRAEGHPSKDEVSWAQEVHDDAARDWFMDLWDSLNAKRAPWESNPWVAAYTFTMQRENIDRVVA